MTIFIYIMILLIFLLPAIPHEVDIVPRKKFITNRDATGLISTYDVEGWFYPVPMMDVVNRVPYLEHSSFLAAQGDRMFPVDSIRAWTLRYWFLHTPENAVTNYGTSTYIRNFGYFGRLFPIVGDTTGDESTFTINSNLSEVLTGDFNPIYPWSLTGTDAGGTIPAVVGILDASGVMNYLESLRMPSILNIAVPFAPRTYISTFGIPFVAGDIPDLSHFFRAVRSLIIQLGLKPVALIW